MELFSRIVISVLLILGGQGIWADPAGSLPAAKVKAPTASASTPLEEITRSFLRGQDLARRGNLKMAAQAYREVLSATPGYIEARYRLAQVLHAIDPKSKEAIDHLRFCVNRSIGTPDEIAYRMDLANMLSQAGLTLDAIEQMRELQRLLPKDFRISFRLAQLYWSQGQGDQAGPILDQLIKQYPRWENPAVLRAKILIKEDHQREALPLLDRVLRSNPNNLTALLERGNAKVAIGDATSAVPDFEAATRVNPLNPEAYRLLSEARMMQGDRVGAKRALQLVDLFTRLPKEEAQRLAALYRKPRRTSAENIQLGSRLAALGRPDLAAPLLEQGLKRKRGDRAAWYLLGKIRYAKGDYQGAAEAFKASGSYMKRQGLKHYQYMSTALLNSGNLGEAQRYINEGLHLFPKDPALLKSRARIREIRQPKKVPTMTSIERNRLQKRERKRRWMEEKLQKQKRRR